MQDLASLQALGLVLPTPAYIFGAVLFGLLGLAAFRSGRKSGRRVTLGLGVALMLYPYVITQTGWLYGVGALLCVGIWADHR